MDIYAVSSDGTLKPMSDPELLESQALDKERLSRAACQVSA
jgi:hypothetical protein